ncbi:antiviral reverse transcriptase Drt3b [Halomonas sp. SCS19]|uniref:antiviral reverse transcriptase Drt3b n=1 Tax=Halomonas sp. SCS19 TaxID=2950870 RepID=UPI0032DE31CE
MLRNKSWKKKKVEKKDYHRVLLTETLPYEVPVHFSNLGFYQKVKNREFDYTRLPLPFDNIKGVSVPFNYEIRNGENKKRVLSIPHPVNQINFIKLYEKFEEQIIFLCSKSKYSLRYPAATGSYFFEKGKSYKKEDERAVDSYGDDVITESSSSFFSYDRYNFVYKFYDSIEYCDLETRFGYLKKLDIKKCFYNVYTHSISWAVKGKEFSKKLRNSYSLPNEFDRIIRDCNNGETNGIVVGPEVSRIFSEIILQELDVKLQKTLDTLNLHSDQEYAIRRYIDDYFVFSNSEEILEIVTEELEKILADYKLHLNESKTEVTRRPFVSGETAAKASAANLIEKQFDIMSAIREKKDGNVKSAFQRPINIESKLSSMIKDYRVIIHEKDIHASSVCNYTLTIILNKIDEIAAWKNIEYNKSGKNFNNFLTVLLLFALYVFSLGVKPRSCYIFSRLVIAIGNNFLSPENPYSKNIKSTISEKLKDIITMKSDSEVHAVELFDLVQLLRWLGQGYEIGSNDFKKLISNKVGEIDTSYFGIMAALDYCKNIRGRRNLKIKIIEHVSSYVLKKRVSTSSAECFMIISDLMACPYLSERMKKNACRAIIKKYWSEQEIYKKREMIDRSAKNLFDYYDKIGGTWFYEWDSLSESSFAPKVLKRKELRTAY